MKQESPPDQDLVRALRRAQDRASKVHLTCLQLRHAAADLRDRAELLEHSISFRLGEALVSAFRSPRLLAKLPRLALDLYREGRRRAHEKREATDRQFDVPTDFSWSFDADEYCEPQRSPEQVGQLRVAAVLDEFSYASFAPECKVLQVEPDEFELDLDAFQPHMLLVESAWRGVRNGWCQKIHPVSVELCYLLDCCRRRGIPTVFWNKEDPSHFEHFIAAARLFDHVFTTDIECVPRYRKELGHDRVHVLPFGCQPRLNNPIEQERRQAAAIFAGSWYCRYPERSREFARMVDDVSRVLPVEIYDRNAGRGDPNFEFPERFRTMIKGSLPFSEIGRAYKAYRFGITVNTVKSSPSMVARRIYELMASNTLVISNPAMGLQDLAHVTLVHGEPGFADQLEYLASNQEARHRVQLKALRHVLLGHTMTHRLAHLASRVMACDFGVPAPRIAVVARVRTLEEVAKVQAAYLCQSWRHKRLVLMTELEAVISPSADVKVIDRSASGAATGIAEEVDWVAMFDPRDHYGPQYLTDLALATLYCDADAIGKSRRFSRVSTGEIVMLNGVRYRPGRLSRRCSILRAQSIDGVVLEFAASAEDDVVEIPGLAIDEFNYCENGGSHGVEGVDVD